MQHSKYFILFELNILIHIHIWELSGIDWNKCIKYISEKCWFYPTVSAQNLKEHSIDMQHTSLLMKMNGKGINKLKWNIFCMIVCFEQPLDIDAYDYYRQFGFALRARHPLAMQAAYYMEDY